ncbi:MAG: DUF885 domain-containing protein [Thermoanaerobaculia bacterium]
MRTLAITLTTIGVLSACATPPAPPTAGGEEAARAAQALVDEYLERTFEFLPSRATAEGLHDHDAQLEDFSPEALDRWIAWNHEAADRAADALASDELPAPDRLDLELLERRARREIFDHEVLWRQETDPLFWTGTIANAHVFLLVRDDRPLDERLRAAAARARSLPRLAQQAKEALGAAPDDGVAAEIARIAEHQATASATFYREGFAQAAPGGELREELAAAGAGAAEALDGLAAFLETLAERATGDPRLGDLYAESFRTVTGIDRPVDEILEEAEAALAAKRAEAAAYGRSVWVDLMGDEPAPSEDREVLSRLLALASGDGAASMDDFVTDFRTLVDGAISFVREKQVMTLPDPFPIRVDRSPAYFVGQAVGGVYPPGPFGSEEATFLFVPTPPATATSEQLAAFFRDFNHHFNVMITPHEIVPGHATQLVLAARHPRKVRALFADGVYVEGWGTFCERLMLDLGWGDPLARLAHLKKQMENIARTIVDIRVHTKGMTRDEVLTFARDEAFQDEQFAGNLWTRTITSSPQLTFYWLGYEQVMGLYEDVRAARGDAFRLSEFMDGMMELGPVPVARYRERMLTSSP